METYKNDYDKNEDFALWELHEIRHQLAIEHNNMTIEEINKRALESWEKIKKRNTHIV